MLHLKHLLIAGLSLLLAGPVAAQEGPSAAPPADGQQPAVSAPQWSNRDMTYRGKNYDIMDSSYYPKYRLKQFRKYINHQEAFPPKPRNMWEVGAGLGLYNVIGNVPTLMLWQKGGGGLHVHVRKSLGYIFSVRAQYIYGVGKNLDRQPTTAYDAPYTAYGYVPSYYSTLPPTGANQVYRATRTETSQLSADLILNAYNINFHQARNSMSFFGYLGLGAVGYKTRVNALDGGYAAYNFSSIVPNPAEKDNKIRKDLQSKMDKSYESAAASSGGKSFMDNKTLVFAPSVGLGMQYKINKQFNVQIEDRYTFPSDGYLDGTVFGKTVGAGVSNGRVTDAINYFSVGINYNVKLKKKAVEPLYWMNPLDHSYNELSYPRHMILPNPVLPDEDNDGITDQFDKCPKSPAGLPVDSHGCPADTDGDGVPDYKDKQLITPTECQPVDADGVGHCPCPDDCQGMSGGKDKCSGAIGSGTILFSGGNTINTGMAAQLSTLSGQMQGNPLCKVVILGSGSGSKVKEQRSWEHVNAIIEHMSEKNNISRDRFIFKYGEAGNENIVTYRVANSDEMNQGGTVAPPHPNLR